MKIVYTINLIYFTCSCIKRGTIIKFGNNGRVSGKVHETGEEILKQKGLLIFHK